MGRCWNCGAEVTLKNEETRCDNCNEIMRYWCWSCKLPFDVENKKSKKKVECKWCGFFLCPNCGICSFNCVGKVHLNVISKIITDDIELNDKAKKIVDYFEDVKLGKEKTTCPFGVPKTYAKERIKGYLVKMEGFKTRDLFDKKEFEKRRLEVMEKPLGYEFTINNSRSAGTYGQEYRDVFNLCVCLGKLKYIKKKFEKNKIIIEYDAWIRINESFCPNLFSDNLIIKYCPNCKKVFPKHIDYCSTCFHKRKGKNHVAGEHYKLKEKVTNADSCQLNRGSFKKKDGGKKKG